MKIAARQVESFVRAPDPSVRAILIYGPDQGAVRERAISLCQSVVEDLSDTFRVVEIPPKSLANDPALLSDEAAAIAFGGGRRVIRVRGAGNDVADRFADFLTHPSGDALIVVEAGELQARAKLRTCFEKADIGAALPCYVDEGVGLESTIRQMLSEAGLTVDPAALDYLSSNLGGDRQVTRRELEKIVLYVEPGGRVGLAEAEACVGDGAATSLDDVTIAAASGDYPALDTALRSCEANGDNAVSIVRAVQRYFHRLHLAAGIMQTGVNANQAMSALRPPVFFKQQDAFRRQLGMWRPATLSTALQILTDTELDCKSTDLPDTALLGRALMRVAQAARQGSGNRNRR
jgi:DNA polymerase III subunit delta